MVQAPASSSTKNIWVAASDGDLDRVKELIEVQGMSPNAKDSNSYTPMHAAASYAHVELLQYLLSKGGDINISDSDGDTPLFTVESIEMAQFLLEHGADSEIQNDEGLTPAQALEEDHPEISSFLSPSSHTLPNSNSQSHSQTDPISSQAIDSYTQTQTSQLLAQSRQILEQAERDGVDPDDRLREVVEQAVRDGLNFGGGIGSLVGGGAGLQEEEEGEKRVRRD